MSGFINSISAWIIVTSYNARYFSINCTKFMLNWILELEGTGVFLSIAAMLQQVFDMQGKCSMRDFREEGKETSRYTCNSYGVTHVFQVCGCSEVEIVHNFMFCVLCRASRTCPLGVRTTLQSMKTQSSDWAFYISSTEARFFHTIYLLCYNEALLM